MSGMILKLVQNIQLWGRVWFYFLWLFKKHISIALWGTARFFWFWRFLFDIDGTEILSLAVFSPWLTFSFSILGHKWDGAHREAGLAKCYDLCHSHLQVLWDLTSPSPPPCSCSTIRAKQALLSSLQPLNPTVNCFTSVTPSPYIKATPSHTACRSSVFSHT